MLKNFLKNKTLTCLMLIAAVCQPILGRAEAKSIDPQAVRHKITFRIPPEENYLKDLMPVVPFEKAEKQEVKKPVLAPVYGETENEFLGKYDLKTGKPIPTIPSRISVEAVDFLLDDGTPATKMEPVAQVSDTKTQTLDIEGIPCLIADTSKTEEPKIVVQSDLKDLLEGLEEMSLAQTKPASKALPAETKAELEKLLKETDFDAIKTPPVQQDLLDLLADTSVAEVKTDAPAEAPKPAVARDTISDINELLALTEPDTSKKPVPKETSISTASVGTKKSTLDDINEILALTDSDNSKPSHTTETGFMQKFKRSAMSLFACGALAMACRLAVKFKHPKTPRPAAPASKVPTPMVVEAVIKQEPEESKILPTITPTRREALANRIRDIKILSEIKEKRAILTREIAKARRQNDLARIDEIQAERQRLTEKKKALCLRMTGTKKAEIKEQRRLLTKQMTIARRHQDAQTIEHIKAEREKLNAQSKALTGFVRKVDYQKVRKAYMKPAVLAVLQRRQHEFARAA